MQEESSIFQHDEIENMDNQKHEHGTFFNYYFRKSPLVILTVPLFLWLVVQAIVIPIDLIFRVFVALKNDPIAVGVYIFLFGWTILWIHAAAGPYALISLPESTRNQSKLTLKILLVLTAIILPNLIGMISNFILAFLGS